MSHLFLKTIRKAGSFDENEVKKVIAGLGKNLNLPKVSSSDEAKDLFAHVNNDLNDFNKCQKLEKVCKDATRINAKKAFALFEKMFFTEPRKFNTKIWSRTHIAKKDDEAAKNKIFEQKKLN